MQYISWGNYLYPAKSSTKEHRQISADMLAGQKENIRKLYHNLQPKVVVCMGAGYLNDIPVDDFVAGDTDIYFAEWMRGISEEAFKYDLVKQLFQQTYACIVCKCSGDPLKYCKSYMKWSQTILKLKEINNNYCANFETAEDAIPLCTNYTPGEFPQFLSVDVTKGKANDFAGRVPKILSRSKKPRHAFRYAIQKSKNLIGKEPLPLEDHSVDFITSSMLISQFDFEPYTYFIRNLNQNFSHKNIDEDIEALGKMEESLRNNLFLSQLEGHFKEIVRLLKPDGKAYLSMETLHREQPAAPWFQVETIPKTMELLGKYFYFDMEALPEVRIADRVTMAEKGESILQAYVLVSKKNKQKSDNQHSSLKSPRTIIDYSE